MTYAENTHVTFTNATGGAEVGVVKGYSNGKYKLELKSGSEIEVAESEVKEFITESKEACPVVGSG